MARVTQGEIAALADGALPRRRRAQVEAAIAASPELARQLAVQTRLASTIRAAAERIEAPARLREAIPAGRGRGSTGMRSISPTPSLPAAARRATLAAAWSLATRVLGALATLAVGAVHLQQYLTLYSKVPTIGTLFVLNFAGATVIGMALLAPIERAVGRLGHAAVALLAVAAIGLAATSFAFLLISEHTPLFGFMEPGYDPPGIAAARISEIATVVLLGAFLVAHTTQRRRSS
jgi:hypothetical protein